MNFTQQVLDDYLNENKERQNWMRTFLKFERSLVGEETNQAMRLEIWNSVIFFNYLQSRWVVLARLALPSNITNLARHSLRSSKSTDLSIIIVWGKRLWNNMPGGHWCKSKFLMFTGWIAMTSNGRALVPNGFYMMPGGKHVKALVVNHPSVGYLLGLLVQGDTKIFEIIFSLVSRFDTPDL